jgi:hypothetical protein
MDTYQLTILKNLLGEEEKFPAKVEVVCGRTLAKTRDWWKAILLVKFLTSKGERYQIRFYGWQKGSQGVYKTRQKFNLSQAKYLTTVIGVLHEYIPSIMKPQAIFSTQKILIDQISGLKSELSKEKKKRTKDLRKIIALKEILGEKEEDFQKFRSQYKSIIEDFQLAKQREMADRIPELRAKLKEFEHLLDNKTKKEKDYHKFLKENPWMFGSWYVDVRSKPLRSAQDIPDFELERYDGLHDLVELESPRDNVFVLRSRRLKQSVPLKDAISEMMQYIDEYIQKTPEVFYKETKEIYKPYGFIIIGRDEGLNRRELRRHNSFLHRIEIWTFDDLVNRAKLSIDFLKEKGKK